MKYTALRSIACTTLVAFSLVALAPPAYAGVIPTEDALVVAAADASRARLDALLAREDVRAQLLAHGVDPTLVASRVASLTDQEARDLAADLDRMPAGGDIVGTVVFVFLVLLLTDLLGWTDIFPFTNKGSIGK